MLSATALSSIIGMTDAVLATELKPGQRRDLRIVPSCTTSKVAEHSGFARDDTDGLTHGLTHG